MFTYWPVLGRIFRHMFSRRYCRPMYLLFPGLITVAILLFRAVIGLTQLLDYVLFPGFAKADVKAPVFIVANPRSGTTFLHRLLQNDQQFTYIKLWQTIVPSITMYKLIGAIAFIDRLVGGPLARLFRWLDDSVFGGWDGIHKTGLNASEEDEQLWVFLFLTPGIMIFYPFMDKLPEALNPDALPPKVRAKLVKYYRRAIQRHVYATGGKTLLAKNAVAAGRLGIYREAFPDMRVVHTVRHPYETFPSTVSMFSRPWTVHSPQCLQPDAEIQNLVEIARVNYQQMLKHRGEFAPASYCEFRYDDLVAEPRRIVEEIYGKFGLEMSPEFREQLHRDCEAAKKFQSGHEYDLTQFGLSEEKIQALAPEIFATYGFAK